MAHTECSYRKRGYCNPRQSGGCPCAEVMRHGGPMTSEQIAAAEGTTTAAIKKLYAKVKGKLRGLPVWRKRRWQELLDGWPTQPETLWSGIEDHAPGELFDGNKMAQQIQRRMCELGWEKAPRRRALRVIQPKRKAS